MPLEILSTAALTKTKDTDQNIILTGIGVSAGIVIGKAYVWKNTRDRNEVNSQLDATHAVSEISRFDHILQKTIGQLEELIQYAGEQNYSRAEIEILEAHLMLLMDPCFSNAIREIILRQRISAEQAVREQITYYCQLFENSNDLYLRQRAEDFKDIGRRLQANLQERILPELRNLKEPSIVVAYDLAPSDTVGLNRDVVLGFVTVEGSRVSHTAIIARALTLPAVVGIGQLVFDEVINDGDMLIVDGARGVVVVRPDEKTLEEYREKILRETEWFERIKRESDLPAETLDGFHVQLAANIEMMEELPQIRSRYGVGVGLFRTEFLFIRSNKIPTEDEQFAVYRKTVEEIYPRSVIFRTMDLGGDKLAHTIPFDDEMNPFLGVRAIRFCLKQPELFLSQLRAMLRASNYGKVRIMFPMVATVDEVAEAIQYLNVAKKQLDERNIAYNPNLDVGIMIEIPSAVMLAEKLAPMVDFFSCGTNDLVQYSMAVDRLNPNVASLYQPMNPAIIKMIYDLTETAYRYGRWVGICGEAASDPLMLPLLLGSGVQEFSMSPVSLSTIKRLVRRTRMYEVEELVQEAIKCSTADEVAALSQAYLNKIDPVMFGEK